MTTSELKTALSEARQFLRNEGHTLWCGQQDQISDHINELEAELNSREK